MCNWGQSPFARFFVTRDSVTVKMSTLPGKDCVVFNCHTVTRHKSVLWS